MLGMSRVQILLLAEVLLSIAVGYMQGVMIGFWTYIGLTGATILIMAGMNHQKVLESLDATPKRIWSWVFFLLMSIGIGILFESMLGFPTIPSYWLGIVTTISIYWSYYTLEPTLN